MTLQGPRSHPADAEMVIVDAEKGRVEARPERTKVAIIGTGKTRGFTPWSDPTWEIWGLNEIDQPRADRWFELHILEVQSPAEMAWLRACRKPVYLVASPPSDMPFGVRFPLEEILTRWPGAPFACTFSYQIALALLEGFDEIGLWGVDLPWGTPRERLYEYPSVAFWLGLATGYGVKIHLPPGGALLRHPPVWQSFDRALYGVEYHKEKDAVARLVSGFFELYRRGAFKGVGGDEPPSIPLRVDGEDQVD